MLLKNGSTGNYVMYLQYGLHIMCCPPGSFDSKFGSGTENAVKKYQGKKGLTQDGIIGDGTWNALVSDIKTIQQSFCLPAKLFPGTRPGSGNNYGFTLRICLTSISTEFQSLSTSP